MKQKFLMWVWLMAGIACAVAAINTKDQLLAELMKAAGIIFFLLTARAADKSSSKRRKEEPTSAPLQTSIDSNNTNPHYT